MISSRGRPIAGVLSLTVLTALVCLSSNLSFKVSSGSPFYLTLIATAISGLNIPILLAWMGFGMIGGVTVTSAAIIVVLLLDFRMGRYGYYVLALPFIFTAYLGYAFASARHKINQLYVLKSEKLDEEINILHNDTGQKNRGISAFEEKLMKYSLLREVAEALSTVLVLDEINRLIIGKTLKTIGKPGRALLFLVDADKQELILSASSVEDDSVIKTKKGDIFDSWVLRHRRSLLVEDVIKDFRFPLNEIEAAKETFGSLIATPLSSENRVIGILRMDAPGESVYTQDDLRLLDIIANIAAAAVENAYLYARTQELAIRDGLTGLKVRRFFMESLHREIKRASRKREKLSVLMLDIDYFKKYNDTYGHSAGDIILKHLAKAITSLVHEDDVVGRYGGEEIAVLLCGRGAREAAAEAEKIRATIKENPLTLRREEATLTVSIGVATYPEDAVSEEEMIRAADTRLYKAKAEGRDRVCSS